VQVVATIFHALSRGDRRNEKQVASDAVNDYINGLHQYSNEKSHKIHRDNALKSCRDSLDYIESTLLVNLFEISVGWLVDPKLLTIGYKELCDFIYLREQLTDVMSNLADTLSSFNEQELRYVTRKLSEKQRQIQQNHHVCSICQNLFVHCGHMCTSCTYSVNQMTSGQQEGGNCPMCNKYKVVGAELNEPLSNTLIDFLQKDHSISDESQMMFIDEKFILKELKTYQTTFNQFAEWYNKAHNQSESDLAVVAVESFLFQCCQKFDLLELKRYDLRRSIVSSLHHLLLPQIYPTLKEHFRMRYKEADNAILSSCRARLKGNLIENIFDEFSEYDFSEEELTKLEQYGQQLLEIEHQIEPFEKFGCLSEVVTNVSSIRASMNADILVPSLVISVIFASLSPAPLENFYSELQYINSMLYKDADPAYNHLDGMEEYKFVTVLVVANALKMERGKQV